MLAKLVKALPYCRRGNDFTKKFGKIATAVSKIKAASLVLDGEPIESGT